MSFKALFICIAAMLVQGVIAFTEGNFTLGQMVARGATGAKPMPFLYHGGMWGDLLLVSPAVAIAWKHRQKWSEGTIFGCLMLCSAFATFAHMGWIHGATASEFIVEPPAYITQAGLLHAMFMAAILTVLVLFYWFSEHIDRTPICIVSILLSLHVFASTGAHSLVKRGTIDPAGIMVMCAAWALIWEGFAHSKVRR